MSELHPRSGNGQFVSRNCPDKNCGGLLQPDREGWWRCDGLTHEEPDGPLYECSHVHHPFYADAALDKAGVDPAVLS